MGKIPMSILLVVTLVATGKVQATTVEFYDDALIQEGDDYFYVSVHDTEPFHTTLYMFGGFVHDLSIHDSSIHFILFIFKFS